MKFREHMLKCPFYYSPESSQIDCDDQSGHCFIHERAMKGNGFDNGLTLTSKNYDNAKQSMTSPGINLIPLSCAVVDQITTSFSTFRTL